MWQGEGGPSAGNPSPIRASKPESGCGAPRTICGFRRRLLLQSRRNSLHRKQQGLVSHSGTERPEKCVVRDLSNCFGGYFDASSCWLPLCLCISMAMFLSACGYHVGGTSSRLPP